MDSKVTVAIVGREHLLPEYASEIFETVQLNHLRMLGPHSVLSTVKNFRRAMLSGIIVFEDSDTNKCIILMDNVNLLGMDCIYSNVALKNKLVEAFI